MIIFNRILPICVFSGNYELLLEIIISANLNGVASFKGTAQSCQVTILSRFRPKTLYVRSPDYKNYDYRNWL